MLQFSRVFQQAPLLLELIVDDCTLQQRLACKRVTQPSVSP